MAVLICESEGEARRTELVETASGIGRNRSSGVQIRDDNKVSGIHCTVYQRQHGYALKDEESRNGTLLNGRRIGTGEYMLGDGDEITVGDSTLTSRSKGRGGGLVSRALGDFRHS